MVGGDKFAVVCIHRQSFALERAFMVKAVLTTKVSPSYDDLPEVRYHFPKTYLNQMQKAVGDWIVITSREDRLKIWPALVADKHILPQRE